LLRWQLHRHRGALAAGPFATANAPTPPPPVLRCCCLSTGPMQSLDDLVSNNNRFFGILTASLTVHFVRVITFNDPVYSVTYSCAGDMAVLRGTRKVLYIIASRRAQQRRNAKYTRSDTVDNCSWTLWRLLQQVFRRIHLFCTNDWEKITTILDLSFHYIIFYQFVFSCL
jgi:hypothetical protein